MKRLGAFALVLLLVPAITAGPNGPAGKITTGGPVSPDGKVQVACDLPVELRKHNIASQGEGCCVFRSIDHAAHWQNVPALYGFPEWIQQHHLQGGGWSGNVTERIAAIAKERGVPEPDYLQYEGKDPAILELALKTGRMPGVTYNGHDGVHYSFSISHMVDLVYLDKDQACILDNNFVGENELVWMSRQEFIDRWAGGGSGWAVILLNGRPPPVPHN